VPVQSPGAIGGFRRRFAGWLERFAGAAEKRDDGQAESHAELRKRIDELEKTLAAAEERFGKQLAESEGRSLHLMEQRAQSMHEELTESQRIVAQRVVTRETGSLRVRVHLATFLSLAAGAASAYALLVMLGLLPR